MTTNPDPKRELLRHTLATLSYRAGKSLRGSPAHYPTLRIGDGARTPSDILAHIGDLLDWALSIASGNQVWHSSNTLPWDAEVERFFMALERFDVFLASELPLHAPPENLFQGPIADAFTHVGQLSLLRRLSDSPVRGENYFTADIHAGRVGVDQAAPTMEFG